MKAILYTRVSTLHQVTEGQSLEAQERTLRQYSAFKGFDEVQLVTDAGISGKTTDRPGFQQVMEAIRTRTVDAVVVYSLSRFARNTIATLQAIEQMNRKDVAFHSVTEQLDTTTPIGRFFVTTIAGLATLEREQIGERTRTVLQFKKANGERVGTVPFGYHLDGDHIVPDEAEQKVIKLVHHLRKLGYSYTEIARQLERKHIPNKAGRVKWSKQQIHRIVNTALAA